MFNIDNILFSIGGYGVSMLELFSVISGLFCVFLAGRGKVFNFWIGYLYSFLLFFLFMQKHLYSSMILQPISLTINIIGHYRWTHPREGEANSARELKISVLSWQRRIVHIVLIAVLALAWGWFLRNISAVYPDIFPPAKTPLLDAFITMTLLTAQYLSAHKKLDCWGAWLVVNSTNIILYLMAGLAFMPIVSGCYLVLAFLGVASWKKQYKSEQGQNN